MDTTRISSFVFSGLFRGAATSLKAELVARSHEATTGRLADLGLSLGVGVAHDRSMTALRQHLSSIADANSQAVGRLAATQDSLQGLSGFAIEMTSLLAAGDMLTEANPAKLAIARATIGGATELMNTTFGNIHIFGGVNTAGAPIADWEGGAAQTALRNAFASRFGFAMTDPAALAITGTDIADFLDNTVRPMFQGADWTSNMSSAADEALRSRIAPGEAAVTSITANEKTFRTLFMAIGIVVEFLGSNLNGDASAAVTSFSLSAFGETSKGLSDLQGTVGAIQNRIADANEVSDARETLLENMIADLEGVDQYEAASRVNALTTQLEASYALTARLQNLNLVSFLG